MSVAWVARGTKGSERDKNMKVDGEEEKEKNHKSGKKRGWKKQLNFWKILVLGRVDQ